MLMGSSCPDLPPFAHCHIWRKVQSPSLQSKRARQAYTIKMDIIRVIDSCKLHHFPPSSPSPFKAHDGESSPTKPHTVLLSRGSTTSTNSIARVTRDPAALQVGTLDIQDALYHPEPPHSLRHSQEGLLCDRISFVSDQKRRDCFL